MVAAAVPGAGVAAWAAFALASVSDGDGIGCAVADLVAGGCDAADYGDKVVAVAPESGVAVVLFGLAPAGAYDGAVVLGDAGDDAVVVVAVAPETWRVG